MMKKSMLGYVKEIELEEHSGGYATISKQAVCSICGENYGQLLEPKSFEVTNKENTNYYKYSFGKVYFKTSGNIEKFDYLKINDSILEELYYEIDYEKEMIILDKKYLNQLETKTYKLEFYYYDGIAETKITIKNNLLMLGLIIIILISTTLYFVIKSNSKKHKRVGNRRLIKRIKKTKSKKKKSLKK